MPSPPAVKVTISLTPSEGKVCFVHTPPHTQPHRVSNWPSMENEMSADRTSVIYYYYYVAGERGYKISPVMSENLTMMDKLLINCQFVSSK